MALAVATLTQVTLGGTDYSDHITSATLTYEREILETTAFGSTSRTYTGGLYNWRLEITIQSDYDDNDLDEVFNTNLGASWAFTGKPSSAATGTGNPQYSGNVLLTAYNPLSAQHGQVQVQTLTFQGTGALSRAVS